MSDLNDDLGENMNCEQIKEWLLANMDDEIRDMLSAGMHPAVVMKKVRRHRAKSDLFLPD